LDLAFVVLFGIVEPALNLFQGRTIVFVVGISAECRGPCLRARLKRRPQQDKVQRIVSEVICKGTCMFEGQTLFLLILNAPGKAASCYRQLTPSEFLFLLLGRLSA